MGSRPQLGEWRYRQFRRLMDPFSRFARERRMRSFLELMRVQAGTRILDLGGQPIAWANVSCALEITILNLANVIDVEQAPQHTFHYIEGDACDLGGLSGEDFDLVYSNSVIEHVGDVTRQKAFASAVLSLNKDYWIQTPSKWFPIEAHCGMPFWWFYPENLQQRCLARWRDELPAWTAMVEETRVIEKRLFQQLFPDATISVERLAGLPKSYIAWRSKSDNRRP